METATRLRHCPNCFSEYDESLDTCPFCGYAPISQSNQYPLALAPGRILAGRYILGRVLGQGGFGITYLAWDARDKVRVAIKEFFPDSLVMRQPDTTQVALLTADRQENFRFGKEQFLAEAKTLAQFVDNPNIVSVYSYFEENGTAYFAMEYVEGESLKGYLKEKGGRLSWDETLQLLTPVMDALQAVHSKGIIHRDVKPDNIFITEDGHTKLLDFGSARYSMGDRSRSLDVVLTAGYAPKEQYARHSRQGPYTDVYSLAACFYACITGTVPTESVERTEDDDLPLPSARGAKLPAYAEDAILKGLSIKAENRWQTMADFKANLLSAAPDDNTDVVDSPSNTHQTVTGNGDDDDKTKNVVLDREGSVTQNNSVITTGKTSFFNSIKKLKTPQIAGIIAAVLVICVFAGYMVIPFKVTDKAIEKDGTEVGLYTGTVVAGKPSGEGRMEYTDGGVYDGSWEKGQREGWGTITFSENDSNNRVSYTGSWKDDQREGQGTMTWQNGNVYEGEWLDNVREGQGTMTWQNGVVYEGEWKNDVWEGQGTMTWQNGNVYEGEWKDGAREGQGTMTFSENDSINRVSYTGSWKDDYREGQGTMTWQNGDVYEGEWKDGAREGQGTMTFSENDSINRVSYTGSWKDDYREGQGTMTWQNGDVYEGEWYDDAPEGNGTYYWSSGNWFEGVWIDGQRNGQGTYHWADGRSRVGTWINDEFVGWN